MSMKKNLGLGAALVLCATNTALAQSGMPTSQPNMLQIFREEVKVGHNTEHEKVELGWPAAYEKAKSPYYYLALVSLTGPSEAWFVSPYDSNQAIGESMKFERGNPTLSAELARLQRADADHLNNLRSIVATARKDLSRGDFPDLAKQRFYEVTTFRVRPGQEASFVAAAKAYGEVCARSGRAVSYRIYQVVAGMPSATYLIFSSLTGLDGFDKMMSDDEAVNKAMTEADQKVFQKFFTEALVSSDTQRFEVNPQMSYVSAEVRASDPAFWMPKKPVVKKTTTAPPPEKPAAKSGSR